MFRTALLRAVRPATVARPAVACFVAPRFIAPAVNTTGLRFYSAPAGLLKEEVEGRIKDLLKGFDKITPETVVSGASHFTKDLGLDSLDTVEVVMAIEEEFSLEIPDKEADNIHSVEQAVNYILSQPDAV